MQFDLIINGAGLAGMSLAVALAKTSLSIALVDAKPPARAPGWDLRVYAISPANRRFLDEIGIWRHLDASRIAPVFDMEIYGDQMARLDFSAYAVGVSELAFIIEQSLMQHELWETVKRQRNVELFCPAQASGLEIDAQGARLSLDDGRNLSARLVVGADGADSWVREKVGLAATVKSYHQRGVVAHFKTEHDHQGRAFQWFSEDGVLAYLPLANGQMSMVWSTADEAAERLCALDPIALAARVFEAGHGRLGELELASTVAAFPLRLIRVPRIVAPRVALIGDAAHALHPLAGHGANLGFQDAAMLAQTLIDTPAFDDIGGLGVLRKFARARAEPVALMQTSTDALAALFAPNRGMLAGLRNAGMRVMNHLPPLRNQLIRVALGT